VHLSDRRRRDRLLAELEEQLLDRQAELLGDDSLDVRERERPDIVLELAELGDDVGRDDVRARRQQLPELDEGRAELVEHLPQVLTALRDGAVLRDEHLLTQRQQVGQAVGLEEVAEAVANRDLRDLRDPADVATLRAGGHRCQCCTGP
jgi:hypothetical protein